VEFTPDNLNIIGDIIVKLLSEESKKDFVKRGWSGDDPKGGPPVWDSFSYKIKGKRTLEIHSSFYGMEHLMRQDVPSRKMTWLTQAAKKKSPGKYDMSFLEKKRNRRGPLVVPIKDKSGNIIFRTAPLTIAHAWVHPGIAKFTFYERAMRKARAKISEYLVEYFMEKVNE